MRVDEAHVISLPERRARLLRFYSGLPAGWPFPPPRPHRGVREEAPPWFRSSDGAWGCRQAHLQILQSAWDRGIEATLVLEDDAVAADHFTAAWQQLNARVPANWDMLMLGGQHIEIPAGTGQIVRCVNTRRTHAYVIRLKAIPHLIRIWSAARRHIDHSLIDFQTSSWVYAPRQFLFGQDAGYSDISHRQNPHIRFWDEAAEATQRTGLSTTEHR